MPKIVDPQLRRREVTQAVFRVIRRDGIEHATLRNIAAEAALAIGSVRHYFAGHAEVMDFAMRELAEQTSRRIMAHAERLLDPAMDTDRFEAAVELLCEFLPLDEQRRLETTAWLAFSIAARTQPTLAPYATQLHRGLRSVVRKVLDRAIAAGGLAADLDPSLETERLAGLIDGLAMAAVLQPKELTGATAEATLRRHLDSLRAPA